MNWTGGSLHRHIKSNSNKTIRIQKDHFAKARLRLQNGSISQVPVHRLRRDSTIGNTFSPVFQEESAINASIEKLRVHGGRTRDRLGSDLVETKTDSCLQPSQVGNINCNIAIYEGLAGNNSNTIVAQNTFENAKRNLLSHTDWLGIIAAKPLRIRFSHQKEMQKIGRHRKTEKVIQTIEKRAKEDIHPDHRWTQHRDWLSHGDHVADVIDFVPIIETENEHLIHRKWICQALSSPNSGPSQSQDDILMTSLSSKKSSHVTVRHGLPKRSHTAQDSEIMIIPSSISTPLPKRRKFSTEVLEHFQQPTPVQRNVVELPPTTLLTRDASVSASGIEKSVEHDLVDDWPRDSPDQNSISPLPQRAIKPTAWQLAQDIPNLDVSFTNNRIHYLNTNQDSFDENEKWIKQAFADDYERVQGAFEFSITPTRPSKVVRLRPTDMLKKATESGQTKYSRRKYLVGSPIHQPRMSTTSNLSQLSTNAMTRRVNPPINFVHRNEESDTDILTRPHLAQVRSVDLMSDSRGHYVADDRLQDRRGVLLSAPVSTTKYPCFDLPGKKVIHSQLKNREFEPKTESKRFDIFEDTSIRDQALYLPYQPLENVYPLQEDAGIFLKDGLYMNDRKNGEIMPAFQMLSMSNTTFPQYFRRSSTKSHYFSEFLTDNDRSITSNSSFSFSRLSPSHDIKQNSSRSKLHPTTNKAYLYSDLRSSPSVPSEISSHFQSSVTNRTQMTNPIWRSRQLRKRSLSFRSSIEQHAEQRKFKVPSLPSDM